MIDKDKSMVPLPKKKMGRPKKNQTSIEPDDKAKKAFLLPVLKIDLNREPSEQVLAIAEREQAHHLGWKVNEVRSVNAQLNMYDSIPMLCRGQDCYYAPICPFKPDFKFEGYLCPLQTMDVYRFFVGYVRDLDIRPTDYVDLKLVEDLVRIDLQLKTVDQKIQVLGLEVNVIGGIVQSTGEAIYQKAAHPLLIHQDKLRNKRRDIHTALIASRREKLDRDRKEGKVKDDITSLFEQVLMASRPKATVSETPAIDAEYTSEDYESEE